MSLWTRTSTETSLTARDTRKSCQSGSNCRQTTRSGNKSKKTQWEHTPNCLSSQASTISTRCLFIRPGEEGKNKKWSGENNNTCNGSKLWTTGCIDTMSWVKSCLSRLNLTRTLNMCRVWTKFWLQSSISAMSTRMCPGRQKQCRFLWRLHQTLWSCTWKSSIRQR